MPRRLPEDRSPLPRAVALSAALLGAFAGVVRAAPDRDRLQQHLVHLAGVIGPRKTGSEADRRAAEYIKTEMEAAGLHVELQPVDRIEEPDGERKVGSWNVLGRLQGDRSDTILVAAHHDTRSSLVPGANDDASGLAVLLEVARETSARPRHLSYLFASFCGEEEGLLGSKAYAGRADLGTLRAVVAVELVGQGELLVGPVPRPPAAWAQRAFLRAARESGISGAAARPIWTIVPRFLDLPFSADHEPFLERGIPSMLLLGTYPAWVYHTPEDGVLRVRSQSLARAATLLDQLLRDFETAAPERGADDPHSLPWMLFGQGIVVPGALLRAFALLTLAAVLTLLLVRAGTAVSFRGLGLMLRVLIVGAACTAAGLSGLFAAQALMARIHKVRHPWSAHHGLHLAHAVALTFVTGWIALKIFRRIKPTVEPGAYLSAALILPVALMVAGLSRGYPELAALAAAPALAFLASLFVRNVGRKFALGLLGALPSALFMTPADYRAAIDLGGIDISSLLLFAAVFAVLLPFVLFVAHVASFHDCLHSRFWWWISGPVVGAAAFVLWFALAIAAGWLPAYDGRHPQVVRLRETIDLASRQARLMVHSNDSLEGVAFRGLGGRLIEGDGDTERIDLPFPGERLAFTTAVSEAPEGEAMAVTCRTGLKAGRPTDRLSYLFTSRSGFKVPERDGVLRHGYNFTEIAPRLDPERTFRLLLPPGGDLQLRVRAEFADDLLDIAPSGGPRLFLHQATVLDDRHLFGTAAAPSR